MISQAFLQELSKANEKGSMSNFEFRKMLSRRGFFRDTYNNEKHLA